MLIDLANIRCREEVLQVLVATREGTVRIYMTPFKRGPFGGIKLADTIKSDEEYQPFYLAPVFDVWLRQGTFHSAEGKRARRVWQPDPLDTCFCGGPKNGSPNAVSRCSNPKADVNTLSAI